MNEKELFKRILGQTSETPLALEIVRADGVYLFDKNGKKYIDLISGISVSNTGHLHPAVVTAVKDQVDAFSHTMVYGEFILSPQVKYAEALVRSLPENLDSVYFVNSGAEAIEGAMKLAKRSTGRSEIISFRNAYHGSTQGALSIMGDEVLKNKFRPLLPETRIIDFNSEDQLNSITVRTAAVFAEPVQGEAGIILPKNDILKKLRKRCDATGTLLVLDEIQTGMGRTGTLFAFEQWGIVPDILCLAKALGGGLPLGAFIASNELMATLSADPPLGHLTTFGGNPVSCAAGLAAFLIINDQLFLKRVRENENIFLQLLKHDLIKETRSSGALMAIDLGTEKVNKNVIARCVENGVITDWFLFNSHSMRIAPPLTITSDEIRNACSAIIRSLDETASC